MVPKSTPITKRSPALGVPIFRLAIDWVAIRACAIGNGGKGGLELKRVRGMRGLRERKKERVTVIRTKAESETEAERE